MSVNKQGLSGNTHIANGMPDSHICGHCSSVFVTIKAFLNHKKKECTQLQMGPDQSKDTDLTSFDSVCVTEFPKKEDDGKKYCCDYSDCSYATKYSKDLQRHMRIHTGEKPYQCEECGKSFSRLDKFKLHSRCHSGVKPYKCSKCNYTSADGSSLKKHLRIHTDERPFKCQICMYASRNSSQLVVHLRTHTGDKPFQCPHCPSKFKINSDLKRHLRLHTGDKPYQCSHCDYKCAVNGNLKTHMRLNHCPENVHRCEQCDFSSSSRKLLLQHEKSHDTAPIQCPHENCPYRCQSEISLKNHLRTHSKEKPYKCSLCDYTSRQPGNVRTHSKKLHGENTAQSKKKSNVTVKDSDGKNSCKTSPARSFKCTLCSSAFVRQDSLRSHLRQHEKLQNNSVKNDENCSNNINNNVLSEVMSPPETVLSLADNSVFSFYPSVEDLQQQSQLVYQLPTGVNVLSLPSTTVQYLFQTSDNCIMLEAGAGGAEQPQFVDASGSSTNLLGIL